MLTAGSSILDVHVGRRLAVVRPQSALARVRDAVATAHLDATHKQSLKRAWRHGRAWKMKVRA